MFIRFKILHQVENAVEDHGRPFFNRDRQVDSRAHQGDDVVDGRLGTDIDQLAGGAMAADFGDLAVFNFPGIRTGKKQYGQWRVADWQRIVPGDFVSLEAEKFDLLAECVGGVEHVIGNDQPDQAWLDPLERAQFVPGFLDAPFWRGVSRVLDCAEQCVDLPLQQIDVLLGNRGNAGEPKRDSDRFSSPSHSLTRPGSRIRLKYSVRLFTVTVNSMNWSNEPPLR